MSKYYILNTSPLVNSNGEALVETHNSIDVGDVWSWMSGVKIDKDEIETIPTVIEMEYETYRGYDGPPEEIKDVGVPIMSKKLLNVIINCGVDNIEFFPVRMKNKKTGKFHEYFAYNVIGLVSVANMDESEFESYDQDLIGDVSFMRLSIDESKANGLMIFRMSENFSALFVHERLKNCIEANGINNLDFMKPEDWVQL